MKKAKKIDVLIVFSILFLAAVFFIIGNLISKSKAISNTVEIYADNKLYGTYTLDTNQLIEIENRGKYVCTVEITPVGVRMLHSTCKNQICVNSGLLTPKKAAEADLNSWIVCLPNSVTVHLCTGETK